LRLNENQIQNNARAPGHNPDGLTEEQVGVSDGWRLLTKEENEASNGKVVGPSQWWDRHTRDWADSDDEWWCGPNETLRTKQPQGHFMPNFLPKKEPRASIEDRLAELEAAVAALRTAIQSK